MKIEAAEQGNTVGNCSKSTFITVKNFFSSSNLTNSNLSRSSYFSSSPFFFFENSD